MGFDCDKCDFKGKNPQSIRMHIVRKHTENGGRKRPSTDLVVVKQQPRKQEWTEAKDYRVLTRGNEIWIAERVR
jgi:hypothetical protein